MFHLTEAQANRIHADLHDLAVAAAQSGQIARAEALQEAAKLINDAQIAAFESRTATARRRSQRQLQGAAR
jgi:hypothetical protein